MNFFPCELNASRTGIRYTASQIFKKSNSKYNKTVLVCELPVCELLINFVHDETVVLHW